MAKFKSKKYKTSYVNSRNFSYIDDDLTIMNIKEKK